MATTPIRYGLGLGPGHLYAADFNADGRSDVFAYDALHGAVDDGVQPERDGTADADPRKWTPGWQPVVARLNNDNAADLILWHAESGAWVHCFRDAVQMFTYRTGTWAPGGRVHALDLNGDGREELLRYDWRTGEWTLGALDGTGATAAVRWPLGKRLGDHSWRLQRRRPRRSSALQPRYRRVDSPDEPAQRLDRRGLRPVVAQLDGRRPSTLTRGAGFPPRALSGALLPARR